MHSIGQTKAKNTNGPKFADLSISSISPYFKRSMACTYSVLCAYAYSGDILGVLLDLSHKEVIFSLNGNCLPPFTHLFRHTTYVTAYISGVEMHFQSSFLICDYQRRRLCYCLWLFVFIQDKSEKL